MHLGLKALNAFLDKNRQADALVLATVIATEGSTYRKPGAMLLANEDGEFAGLISGGCLESDLVAQARDVLDDGVARRIDYDLKDDDELVLGLGLGCGGAVHLLLQRLEAKDGFQPLGALFHALERGVACRLGLVVSGDDPDLPPGGFVLETDDGVFLGHDALLPGLQVESGRPGVGGPGAGGPGADRQGGGRPGVARRAQQVRLETKAGVTSLLVVRIEPTPRVLVCGAGIDALPVIGQVLALGWDCLVADHRPASLAPGRLPAGAIPVECRPHQLADAVDLARIDAAVVMSHHVGHDADYLAQLAEAPPPYLGLLGPRARKTQLLEDVGRPSLPVRGPVGLDIGAELPESIALAIVAEIHAVLNRRDGRSLDG